MTSRFRPLLWATLASAVALGIWTWLTLGTSAFAGLDATSGTAGPPVLSGEGQILSAISFVLHPWVTYAVSIGLALWARRRRLLNLAWALVITPVAVEITHLALKAMIRRPRPDGAAPLLTSTGWAYPSGHMAAITALGVLVGVTVAVTRRPMSTQLALRALMVALVAVVAYDRWALRAHYLTDVVGGLLLGLVCAQAALLVTGVRTLAPWGTPQQPHADPSVAIVVNPTKVADWEVFRHQIDGAVAARGWDHPLWIETSADDAGLAATQQALDAGASLVLAAGGDGTVRAAAKMLANTEVPLAVLPQGTGNLLARNLGVPLDLDAALDVALDGANQELDLVLLMADDDDTEHPSVVMAGMGIDAAIMSNTNPDLKRTVGPAAYVVAAAQVVNETSFGVRVEVDDEEPTHAQAGLALIANVGQLQAGMSVAPQAKPDDGILDVMLAEASSPADWVGIGARILTGTHDIPGVQRLLGRHITLTADTDVAFQVDGDTIGTCRRLDARVLQRAVLVRVPR